MLKKIFFYKSFGRPALGGCTSGAATSFFCIVFSYFSYTANIRSDTGRNRCRNAQSGGINAQLLRNNAYNTVLMHSFPQNGGIFSILGWTTYPLMDNG